MFFRRTRNTTSRSKVERSRIQRRAGQSIEQGWRRARVTRITMSSSLPRPTRTHTTPWFTDDTPVTGCTWRLTCGPPLPRTQCQLWQSSWVRLRSRRLVLSITDVFTQQVVESNALISSLVKLNAGSKLMTRAFKLKAGYMELMGSITKTVCPEVTSESTKQLGEPSSESASQRRRLRIWRPKRIVRWSGTRRNRWWQRSVQRRRHRNTANRSWQADCQSERESDTWRMEWKAQLSMRRLCTLTRHTERFSVMKCPVKFQTLEMKAHPAETFMEVRMFSVLKPVVEYIQQASKERHAQQSTDNTSTHCRLILGHTPASATGGESPGSPPSHDWPTGGCSRRVARGSGHREQVVVVPERKKNKVCKSGTPPVPTMIDSKPQSIQPHLQSKPAQARHGVPWGSRVSASATANSEYWSGPRWVPTGELSKSDPQKGCTQREQKWLKNVIQKKWTTKVMQKLIAKRDVTQVLKNVRIENNCRNSTSKKQRTQPQKQTQNNTNTQTNHLHKKDTHKTHKKPQQNTITFQNHFPKSFSQITFQNQFSKIAFQNHFSKSHSKKMNRKVIEKMDGETGLKT